MCYNVLYSGPRTHGPHGPRDVRFAYHVKFCDMRDVTSAGLQAETILDVCLCNLSHLPTSTMAHATHPAPHPSVVFSFPTPSDVLDPLASFILKAQKETIDKKGRFTVAISGGSLPKMLSGLIGNPAVKWDKWYVYLGNLADSIV